jgi:Tfp pilus assembly protein PilF
MRAAIAFKQGRFGVAVAALEAALDTGQMVPGADTNEIMASVVDLSMRERDYARALRWSQRYLEAGGTNDSVRVLRLEALRLSGDEAAALKGWKERREAAQRSGTKLPESHMRVIWALLKRLEPAAAVDAMEQLARAYPRAEYFADLVATAATGEMPDRDLMPLYRLMRATGYLNRPPVVLEMAQTALRVGYPGESRSVLDEAQKSGVLPAADTPEVAKLRTEMLRALAADERDRAAAEADARRAADGNRLADLGWSLFSALPPGASPDQVLPGLTMIEQALARGGLRREPEVRLNLGIAQLAAGRRDEARRTLQALARETASSGTRVATAARLWSMWAEVPALLPPRN